MSDVVWVVKVNPFNTADTAEARKWVASKPTDCVFVGRTAEEVRARIPEGAVMVSSSSEGDSFLIETWIL